jgi:hypothetical protein
MAVNVENLEVYFLQSSREQGWSVEVASSEAAFWDRRTGHGTQLRRKDEMMRVCIHQG